MKSLLLVSLLALGATASAQTQAYLDSTSFVTTDSLSYPIDPNSTFEVRHSGNLRGRVIYATQKVDPDTGLYVEPNLVTLWSVRNNELQPVGSQDWLGDDDNQTVMSSLGFDPYTGIGLAQLDIPMAQFIGESTYYTLPHGGTHLLFAFGEQGLLGLDPTGWPINFDHWAIFSFPTEYPDVLTYADRTSAAVGERVQITVVMNKSVEFDDILQIDIIGDVELQLEDGGPINRWSLPIPKGTRVYAIDLITKDEGSFYARASISSGAFGDSTWVDVSGVLNSPESGGDGDDGAGSGKDGDDGSGDGSDTYESEEEKRCRPGKCDPTGGDKLVRCTAPFVELVQTPPNPDCPSGNVGMVFHGGCTKGEEECYEVKQLTTCPKYKYAGTEDRSVGEVEVGLKIGVEGQMNWLIVKAKTTAEFHTTVMSPISRRCCKYVPVPGETVRVNIRTCR